MKKSKLIIGFHSINAKLWKDHNSIIKLYILTQKKYNPRIKDIISKAKENDIKIIFINLDRMDALTNKAMHQGIVAVIDISKENEPNLIDILNSNPNPLLLILDGITDPQNLGSCFRVADAMAVDAIIVPKNKSAGINYTVSKVACGSDHAIPYITVTNLANTINYLKKQNIWILGTDANSKLNLYDYDLPKSIAWVIGSEGKGMRKLTKDLCDDIISIPMYGKVESLNVAISAAILLSETRRRL